jgi:hypothetical protein
MWAAAPAQICELPIWDRITGWEVVAAVLLIATAWAAVQIARMYFLAEAARACPHSRCEEKCRNGSPDDASGAVPD